MTDTTSVSSQRQRERARFWGLTPVETELFDAFKSRCENEGFLEETTSNAKDDMSIGICDDGTLLRFLRARRFNEQDAFEQYRAMRMWRVSNRLIELFEQIDVEHYEETRKLYTHWTGRRDKTGNPLFLFEIGLLTPGVMSTYEKSCTSPTSISTEEGQISPTESTAMLRLFCTYDGLVRFVLPLCSAVPDRPNPETPVTASTCIIDISGMGLLQFWRLRTHLQAASTLATANYPETLGRTYVIGAPFFFPTIWGWINKWFDQNTVSKISIVPTGDVLSTLSVTIDPTNIPRKYGGEFDFQFGMVPDLDPEIREMLEWLPSEPGKCFQDLPLGPMRWVNGEQGKRIAAAVGSVGGKQRLVKIMALV